MIRIQQVQNIHGERVDVTIASAEERVIQADKLTLLPALIDPHVHFRTPGMEHKEDWRSAAKAALRGGYTTVFDMPNTIPPTVTAELLREKKALIDAQLKEVGIPLRYQLFFGADKKHFAEIHQVKDAVIGIKVFMGCSTGSLVIDDDSSLHAIFALAAAQKMLIAVHAEDEALMHARAAQFDVAQGYSIHSQIRNVEVATRAVAKAITLARIYGVRLYILHVSTAEELELIKAAKQQGLPVFAEVCPHHLFLNISCYEQLAGKAVMNPPLRDSQQQQALFAAIHEGVIDTVGTDHAPHTVGEKTKPYGQCAAGVPGIETALPLLLNAYHQGLLTLTEIVALTSQRARSIFQVAETDDVVLVDLDKEATVNEQTLRTKCGWSPYAGFKLRGWPVYTILRGAVYDLDKI